MAFNGYPPPEHILGDLGMEVELMTESTAKVRSRVTPFVTTADGGVRSGVLATLVDVVGGAIAARVLRPDWMATADMALQLVGPICGPWVEARGSVARRGRTTLVIEAFVVCVEEDGTDSLVNGRPVEPVAWASMTFSVLSADNPTSSVQSAGELPVRWAFEGGGLNRPILEVLPVEVVDTAAGRLSLAVRPYLYNSFRAVQGGVIALLAEAAGAETLGAAYGCGGGAFVITDLQIAYLALGRVGPVVTAVRVLGSGRDGRAGAVVELRDTGADDRLMTVVNVSGAPASVLAGAAT
jgi:uncharacterized protein (TIGR00369 family)